MPSQHNNLPNLTTLAYRLGTQPTFLRRMLARLETQTITPPTTGTARQPLSALTTRDSDDPAITLLDAWAVALDVLTFYQERIANEGYLQTAAERRSIVELTRAIGYELRPGLAASVSLAFTVQATPGAPGAVSLAAGLKVQSIPGQGQLPQTFETMEAIEARPEWNVLQPYQPLIATPQVVDGETTALWLTGINPALQPGQRLLVLSDKTWYLPAIQTVAPDTAAGYTSVSFNRPLSVTESGNLAGAVSRPQVFAFRQQAALFGHNAPRWEDMPAAMKQAQGGVYRLAEAQWTPIQSGLPYRAVQCLVTQCQDNTEYLFAGTAGEGVYRSADNGQTWTPCNTNLTNPTVYALLADPAGNLLAGATDGMIFRSLDNGESWSRLSIGSLVEKDKETDVTSVVSNGLPSTTIYALATYDEQTENNETVSYLCAGTDKGIYQSADEGVSWTQLSALKGVRALLVEADGQLLAGTRAGLFRIDRSFDPPAETPFTHASLAGKPGQALALTSEGDTALILLGTNDSILTAAAGARANAKWSPLAGSAARDVRALAVGQDGALFAATPLAGFTHKDWPGLEINARVNTLDLDGVYPRLLADSWVMLVNQEQSVPYQIRQTSTVLRSDFGQTATKVTRLELVESGSLAPFDGASLRQIEVFGQSEQLTLFEVTGPLVEPVQGNQLELNRAIPPLAAGRRVVVSGRPVDRTEPDQTVSEVGLVSGVNERDERSLIVLREPLQHAYERATVTIRANVVLATHGETVANEVLGSGNGAQTNQRFRLKKSPLTYVSAPTASGAASTLTVRVNGIRWSEVESLHTLDANSQSYIIRRDDKDGTTLIFGDGQQGARLPSGMENVVGVYRSGLGLAGEVPANSLTLLQTRPLGVVEVTNPAPASGAADPESVDRARQNAPRTVLTMDRIVSMSDFEDFARMFSGIGQAQAALLWTGETRLVHITLADSDGDPVEPGSTLYTSLIKALDQRRNRLQQVQLAPYEPVLFNLDARVTVDPRYSPETVEHAVSAALFNTFSFQSRDFGQAVAASEVIAVIQSIPGVIAVDLNYLYKSGDKAALKPLLPAVKARWSEGEAKPAQLLLLNPGEDGVSLEIVPLE